MTIPRKLLVVDDDPIIRDMMVDILEFEGYTVHTARNGQEALKLLRGEEPYLVFLDLMMPVMSGEELCTHLQSEPEVRRQHVIVLMSALDRLEEAGSLKADAIMSKPFVVEDALNVIAPFMGG